MENATDDVAIHTLELCAGVGMLGEGVRAAFEFLGIGHRTVCYVEREAAAAAQLVALMEAGALDAAPVWSDMLTFDGRRFRGLVDCVAAGFPCQDLSVAGRRAGLNEGTRSGLFFRVLDIADDSGASFLVLENVAGIATATASVVDEEEGDLEERAAARVLGELADRGWHAEWLTLSASDVGASHVRERWFCFAWRMDDAERRERDGSGIHTGRRGEGAGAARIAGASERGHGHVAHAERAERGPVGADRAGSLQGNDPGGREAHGGARVAGAILADAIGGADERRGIARELAGACGLAQGQGNQWQWRGDAAHDCIEAVGSSAGTRLPQPGQPGQPELPAQAGRGLHHRSELADGGMGLAHHAQSDGRNEGRPESSGEQGRPNATKCGGELADTRSTRLARGGAGSDEAGRQQPHGHAGLAGGSLFAPGPDDPRWAGIISQWPGLAPATESGVRMLADGLALVLDESRNHQLRQVGNGVVPLCAAVAFVVLARRAGIAMQREPERLAA